MDKQKVFSDVDMKDDGGSESSSYSWDLLPLEPSTVIDLNGVEDSAAVDGEAQNAEQNFMEGMRGKIVEEVGGQVWAAGKSQARRFFDLYANIDVLRPYFDVEPKDVLKRLVQSLVPKKPTKPQTVAGELYGPMMIVFTLIALLLFSMKYSGHTVQEGTLMGTAFGVCFGYWFVASSISYLMAYLCNSHITMLQIVSLTGYALFGHCVCIFVATVSHETTHGLFYAGMLIIGGLSSLRMICVYVSRTWSRQQGIIIGCVSATLHLLFLTYLHFAYHATYEEAASLISAPADSVTVHAVERTKREVVTNVINIAAQIVLPTLAQNNHPVSKNDILYTMPPLFEMPNDDINNII